MADHTWVLASSNLGKIREFQQRLEPIGIKLLSQSDFFDGDVEETGTTFVENALIKARAIAESSPYPVLADDSGLCVAALNGAPGVFSARYAGEPKNDLHNNEKLLAAMDGIKDRNAFFCCVLVLLNHAKDPLPIIVQARWNGTILTEQQGEGGFGYDPLFYLKKLGCSSAELSQQQKNRISHRGQAIDRLLSVID